jgi:hypothetical protein
VHRGVGVLDPELSRVQLRARASVLACLALPAFVTVGDSACDDSDVSLKLSHGHFKGLQVGASSHCAASCAAHPVASRILRRQRLRLRRAGVSNNSANGSNFNCPW